MARVQARAPLARRSNESPHRSPNEISSSVWTFTSIGSLPPTSCTSFTSKASSEHELGFAQLYELGVIWRTRPHARLGSLPWHHILDEMGAMIVAEYLGIDQREVGYRSDQRRTLIDSQRLRHTRAANGFFTRMIYVARSTASLLRVAEWRGESWCARRWQLVVRPDGYARLEHAAGSLQMLLELDLGTENLGRLEDKMERYRVLARAATAPDVVLFGFPSEAREASARRVLGGTPMPVATATLDRHLSDPLGPNWLLIGGDRRFRLGDLPARRTA